MKEGDLMIQSNGITGFLSRINNVPNFRIAIFVSAYDTTENYRMINNI